jgi:hypothetical protein
MVAHPNLLQAMESSLWPHYGLGGHVTQVTGLNFAGKSRVYTVGRAAPPLTVHFLLAMMTKKTVFSTR